MYTSTYLGQLGILKEGHPQKLPDVFLPHRWLDKAESNPLVNQIIFSNIMSFWEYGTIRKAYPELWWHPFIT